MATVHKQEMTTAPQAAPHVTVGLACGHISKEPMASGAPYYQNSLRDGTFGLPSSQRHNTVPVAL